MLYNFWDSKTVAVNSCVAFIVVFCISAEIVNKAKRWRYGDTVNILCKLLLRTKFKLPVISLGVCKSWWQVDDDNNWPYNLEL